MDLKKSVDNLCVYDPGFSGYGQAFVSDLGGSSESVSVSSMDDLKAVVAGFCAVKFLEICLHGSPGMIHFANGGAMVGQYLGDLARGTDLLSRNARILFASCDIGKGDAGDRFMSELAKRMLVGKGGIIGAATVSNMVVFPKSSFALGPFMVPLSGGRLKVRKYDTNGDLTGERTVDRYGNR